MHCSGLEYTKADRHAYIHKPVFFSYNDGDNEQFLTIWFLINKYVQSLYRLFMIHHLKRMHGTVQRFF